MAYSQDYQQMILAKLKSGATYRELSLGFGISTRTIQKWGIVNQKYITYTHRT